MFAVVVEKIVVRRFEYRYEAEEYCNKLNSCARHAHAQVIEEQ